MRGTWKPTDRCSLRAMEQGRAGVGGTQTSAHPNWPIAKVLNSWLHRRITSSLLAGLSTLYFSFSIHFMRDIYKGVAYMGARGEEVPGPEASGRGQEGVQMEA